MVYVPNILIAVDDVMGRRNSIRARGALRMFSWACKPCECVTRRPPYPLPPIQYYSLLYVSLSHMPTSNCTYRASGCGKSGAHILIGPRLQKSSTCYWNYLEDY